MKEIDCNWFTVEGDVEDSFSINQVTFSVDKETGFSFFRSSDFAYDVVYENFLLHSSDGSYALVMNFGCQSFRMGINSVIIGGIDKSKGYTPCGKDKDELVKELI